MSELSAEQAARIPEEIPTEWNETDVATPRDFLRETGKELIFEGVITHAFAGADVKDFGDRKATNNLQLALTLRAVDGAGELAGPAGYLYITLPTPNPAVPGHKPYASKEEYRKLYDRTREFLRAVGAELPTAPVKVEEGVYKDPGTGVILDQRARQIMFDAVDAAARQQLAVWYNELKRTQTCALINSKLYFSTYLPQKGKRTKVGWLRNEAGTKEIIRDGFAYVPPMS